jgi:zinc protease
VDPDYPALTLAGYIFGSSGMNSRLFARIRGKEGLSYGVGGQVAVSTQDDMAAFIGYAICAPQNAPKVEAVFKEEFRSVIDKGFSAEEVEAAKKSWLQLQQVNRANDRNLVSILTMKRFWNRTMQFDSELEKQIGALTPDQLRAAFLKHLDSSSFGYFRAGDFQKANVVW